MKSSALNVVNTLFDTRPVVIHAHGSHGHKPNWPPIRDAFFGLPPRKLSAPPDLTIITCNNGHPSMGLFEKSLDRLGLPYIVLGAGIDPWVNARDKPLVLEEGLARIDTPYVLYADSRDAILIDDPARALNIFREQFNCRLLLGADRINWPPIRSYQLYEDSLAAGHDTEFRYINGGAWIGETKFCREFFGKVRTTAPEAKAPESEQGIMKKLLPGYEGEIALDYHCRIIQNIGFVTAPVFKLEVHDVEILEEL